MAALGLGRHAAAAVRAAQVQALRSVVVLVPSHWTPGVMYAPLRRALEATGDYTTDLFAYSRHESRWEALPCHSPLLKAWPPNISSHSVCYPL